jgi:hypothetical protein
VTRCGNTCLISTTTSTKLALMCWKRNWCMFKHAQTCLYYNQVTWLPLHHAIKLFWKFNYMHDIHLGGFTCWQISVFLFKRYTSRQAVGDVEIGCVCNFNFESSHSFVPFVGQKRTILTICQHFLEGTKKNYNNQWWRQLIWGTNSKQKLHKFYHHGAESSLSS